MMSSCLNFRWETLSHLLLSEDGAKETRKGDSMCSWWRFEGWGSSSPFSGLTASTEIYAVTCSSLASGKSQMWCCMPPITILRSPRQEDYCEFHATLDNILSSRPVMVNYLRNPMSGVVFHIVISSSACVPWDRAYLKHKPTFLGKNKTLGKKGYREIQWSVL